MFADGNLFWDVDGAPVEWCTSFKDRSTYRPIETVMEMGYDIHSEVADPMFEDVENRNFTLKPESPAFKLGFRQIDLTGVGVRAEENWD